MHLLSNIFIYKILTFIKFIIILFLLSCNRFNGAFNIDVKNGYIIKGKEKSLFGISVDIWKDNESKTWVVVAAPKSDRSRFPHSELLGNIHFCGMNKACKDTSSIPAVLNQDENRSLDYASKANLPSIGLGETLVASKRDGDLLVCSPRSVGFSGIQNESVTLQGKCYNLKTPNDQNRLIINPYSENSYDTPSANFGFAAHVFRESRIYMGGPLMFQSSGAICQYNKESTVFTKSEPPESYTSAYKGSSIVSGKFDGIINYLAVASPGEPNLLGKVDFYFSHLVPVRNFMLEGYEEGARFGQSLAAGDFDGDSVDDLVVSAHLSTVTLVNKARQKYSLQDAGTVFIYYAPVINLGWGQIRLAKLKGKQEWGYFGYSIMCPGDLNSDGYDDLVIGAPFESGGNIYVYSGSNEGVITNPTQTISRSAFVRTSYPLLYGFGWSLGYGNLDKNNIPDIVVGIPMSDSVVVLRSAPAVKLEMSASFTDSGVVKLEENKCRIELKDKSKATLTCFDMKLKIQYVSDDFDKDMDIVLSIYLDEKKDQPRILFKNHKRSFVFKRSISNAKHPPKEFKLAVYVKPTKPSLIEPIYAKVMASLSSQSQLNHQIGAREPRRFDSPVVKPTLDIFSKKEIETSVRLMCENEINCYTKPDLYLNVDAPYTQLLVGSEKLIRINITISVKQDPAFQLRLNNTTPSEMSFARVDMNNKTPIREIVWCQIERKDNILLCYVADYLPAGAVIKFSLLFKPLTTKLIKSFYNSTNENIKIKFSIFSDTSDKIYDEKKSSKEIVFNPIFKSDINIISISSPDSVQIHTKELQNSKSLNSVSSKNEFDKFYIGPNITHKYFAINGGPAPIMVAEIKFKIPTPIGNFPAILILGSSKTTGPIECDPFNENSTFNNFFPFATKNEFPMSKDKHEHYQDLLNKTKRETNIFSSISKSQIFDCSNFHCSEITCRVNFMAPGENVSLEIGFMLLPSWFSMTSAHQFTLMSEFEFKSKISKTIFKEKAATYLALDQHVLSAKAQILEQWWIVLISIIVGLLIIVAISGGLFKLGFFKRKRLQNLPVRSAREHEATFNSESTMTMQHQPIPTPIEEKSDWQLPSYSQNVETE